jgi:hypothetical protein
MARRLGVELFLDDTAYLRGLQRSAKGTTHFVKEVERAGRGAAAGSGLFRGFGRSIAFASGGFLAFESGAAFLRESVDAARDAAVSQRALAAQMKASGQSFKNNQERIEEAARSYSRFGFQNDEVIKSLTVLERGTGSINKALRLQQLAADLARAKNIELSAAALSVAKVFGGQETALRRAVPGLHQSAHGWDLIALAQQRLAGQAAANTTVSERFQATLHDTQEIIGTALLPTLNLYLTGLSNWMADAKNVAKLQRNANAAAKAGAGVFNALAGAVGLVADAYGKYQDIISHLPKAGGLRTFFGGTLLDQVKEEAARARKISDYFTGANDFSGGKVPGGGGDFPTPPGMRGPTGAAAPTRRPRSLVGRFNLAELRLAQAQLTKTQADDRRILVIEAAILEKQVAGATKLKEKVALTQQLAGVQSQILGIDQASADAQKRATEAIKRQNELLKTRAAAIKSAVLSSLDRHQAGVENQRALTDALAGLHTAQLLGGKGGIRLAQRGVADARFAILRAGLEAAPATLRGGKFTLGNTITVNVHGVTDPAKVANQVVSIIQRRARHTTTQSRGPTAGGR